VSGFVRPDRVAPVALRDIAAAAGVADVRNDGEDHHVVVTGVTHDSTAVRPGDLYAAMPGANRHGGEFSAAVAGAGAAAILTDPTGAGLARAAGVDLPVLVVSDPRSVLGDVASAAYGHPSLRLPIIGITGTAGKTTTAYLIESALGAAGHATGLIGTVDTRLGGLVVDSVRTTPEATDLHALLAAALERGVTAAVMEVSSHALTYGRVNGVRFAVGGWTNFGLDHLDFHAGVDDYFAAKARLFDGRCRVEILNADDPAVRRLLRPGRLAYSAAGDPQAQWQARDTAAEGFTQRFTVIGPDGLLLPAAVGMPGRHNVANALLAIASAVAVGVDVSTAVEGVAACRGVPGRLELVAAPGPVLGVVDYAHKPDAIVAALAALRGVGRGRVIAVIGAGGDRDAGKRPYMGEAAARGADVVVVTDDNPRTEAPDAIRAQVRAGAEQVAAARVVEVAGRREAIGVAVGLAAEGDIVVLLGKGHETGQEIDGVIHPFDDRVVLAAALHDRFAGAVVRA
jgi:UDP-N-acetylmuramoyl-L-alanyl-D-glutamate--2,6-diaminopimelate ligase